MRDPATLYYVRVQLAGERLYKVGITHERDVLARFTPADRKRVTVVRVWRFKMRKWAKAKERQILLHGLDDRYHGRDVLASGNSELFAIDVLGLDTATFPEP